MWAQTSSCSRNSLAIIGQWNWLAAINNFEVRNLQCSQRVGIEIEVGILYFCVLVALCGEGDVSAVREEHAIFLHGSRHNLCRRGKFRHVKGCFQAKMRAHRWSGNWPARSTGVRGWMHKYARAHSRIEIGRAHV